MSIDVRPPRFVECLGAKGQPSQCFDVPTVTLVQSRTDGRVVSMSSVYRLDEKFEKSVRNDFGVCTGAVLRLTEGRLQLARIEQDPSLRKAAEQTLSFLPWTPKYTVDSNVSLTPEVEGKVATIAAQFYQKTSRALHVLSGTRDPAAQARAMFDKVRSGGNLVAEYADKVAVQEIADAYSKGVGEKLGDKEIVRRMATVIELQVARNVFISKHLRARAVDVRTIDLSTSERAALIEIVSKQPETTHLLEGTPPHLHVSFGPP